jgi:hypothetical protein
MAKSGGVASDQDGTKQVNGGSKEGGKDIGGMVVGALFRENVRLEFKVLLLSSLACSDL